MSMRAVDMVVGGSPTGTLIIPEEYWFRRHIMSGTGHLPHGPLCMSGGAMQQAARLSCSRISL